MAKPLSPSKRKKRNKGKSAASISNDKNRIAASFAPLIAKQLAERTAADAR